MATKKKQRKIDRSQPEAARERKVLAVRVEPRFMRFITKFSEAYATTKAAIVELAFTTLSDAPINTKRIKLDGKTAAKKWEKANAKK
jgi:hypothetical protein